MTKDMTKESATILLPSGNRTKVGPDLCIRATCVKCNWSFRCPISQLHRSICRACE